MKQQEPEHVFWDSCVFILYLTQADMTSLPSIRQYLHDAKSGRVIIHLSTLAFAEIRPRYLKQGGYGGIDEFFEDFEGAFNPVEPNANIMACVGKLRDHDYKHATKKPRTLGTADAIHLMTAVYIRDTLGISNIEFHTFDDGRRSSSDEGKCVSLLSFEEWTSGLENDSLVRQVLALPRHRPIHPAPQLIVS